MTIDCPFFTKFFIAVLVGSCLSISTQAAEATHQASIDLRARLASLKTNNNNGQAASLRLRLAVDTQWYSQLETLVEFDHIQTHFNDQHSNGVRLNGEPSIPDVPLTDLNQAWLNWRFTLGDIKLGRQTIAIGDERFIGSVSVWQNEQSFDAARLNFPILQSSRLDYAYLNRVNRIFGDPAEPSAGYEVYALQDESFNDSTSNSSPNNNASDFKLASHWLALNIEEWDYHKLSLFLLKLNNQTKPEQDSQTLGADYHFKYKAGSLRWHAKLSYAQQTREAFDNASHNYHHLEVGLGLGKVTVFVYNEKLSGDGQSSFITPLATQHDHQGWADVFGSIPTTGLNESVIRMLWRQGAFKLDMRAHEFHDGNNETLGSEIDLDLIWRFSRDQNLSLRFARFEANDSATSLPQRAQRVILSFDQRFE